MHDLIHWNLFLHQAGDDVALSNDWIKPTEEPDESQDGGNVQTPAEGETSFAILELSRHGCIEFYIYI